jgi:hypothetical protein
VLIADTLPHRPSWLTRPPASPAVPALAEARERLGRVADERHLGFDGLWTLPD